jgi:uncharacterized protein involved in exopolysaccharide biosynthesis
MDQNELTAQKQIAALWRAKWLILGATAVCAAAAATAAILLPKEYEATVEVSPGSPDKGGSFGSSTSDLGGLAALAGISLGNDSVKSEAIAVLQSESLTEGYIQKNNLLPIIYSKDWDAKTNSWRTAKAARTRTLWMANRDFERSIRKVTSNAKTGLVTLKITWRDPRLAAQWANGLVRMANDALREKATELAERNIAYLNGEAAKTNVVEMRQAIFTIMQKELTKAMIARGSEEYGFKVIDAATVAELPSFPRKTVWTLAGAVGGLLLSVTVVSIRSNLKV